MSGSVASACAKLIVQIYICIRECVCILLYFPKKGIRDKPPFIAAPLNFLFYFLIPRQPPQYRSTVTRFFPHFGTKYLHQCINIAFMYRYARLHQLIPMSSELLFDLHVSAVMCRKTRIMFYYYSS